MGAWGQEGGGDTVCERDLNDGRREKPEHHQETERRLVQLDPNAGEMAGKGSGKDPEVGGSVVMLGGHGIVRGSFSHAAEAVPNLKSPA